MSQKAPSGYDNVNDRQKDSFDYDTDQGWYRKVKNVDGLLQDVEWDYVAMVLSVGDTVETYTFRDGGSGGTIVRVIVVTYTTSDRDVLVSAERTT